MMIPVLILMMMKLSVYLKCISTAFCMDSRNPCCFLDLSGNSSLLFNQWPSDCLASVTWLTELETKTTQIRRWESTKVHMNKQAAWQWAKQTDCVRMEKKKEWGISNNGREKYSWVRRVRVREGVSLWSSCHRCPRFLLFPADLLQCPNVNATVADVRAASGVMSAVSRWVTLCC